MAALNRPALPAPRIAAKIKPGKPLVLLLSSLVIAVALFQVNQFSHLTRTSYAIDDLNQQRAQKQAENHDLEAEVAQLSSLARVEWEARIRLGLVPAEKKLFIQVNNTVPDRESLPWRFLPAAHVSRTAGGSEPVWKRALHLIPLF